MPTLIPNRAPILTPTRPFALPVLCILAALIGGCGTPSGAHDASQHAHATSGGPDVRQLVSFPEAMKAHTLANMRDHLLALSEIQAALAAGTPDKAGDIAERRLGMGSLKDHNAHESSKFMPQGMQDVGTAMHRAASRFALEAQNAAVTGELKPALAALASTTQACVACHAAYRLQ